MYMYTVYCTTSLLHVQLCTEIVHVMTENCTVYTCIPRTHVCLCFHNNYYYYYYYYDYYYDYYHFSNLQQSYQTRYHKSFRVSDILPGVSGMKPLIEACHGIKVCHMYTHK